MPSNQNNRTAPSTTYRHLDQYYGLIPGTCGTVRGPDGELKSPPVPAFAPPMAMQTVPDYSKPAYIGTPRDLQHGLAASEMQTGHFTVENAYSKDCTTFQMRPCAGTVPQETIPLQDRPIPQNSQEAVSADGANATA